MRTEMADERDSRTYHEKSQSTPIRLLKEIAKAEIVLDAIGDAIMK